jgi:hypothetical protein
MRAIIATHTTMTTAMTRIHPHPDPHEWFHHIIDLPSVSADRCLAATASPFQGDLPQIAEG